jgi:23S rRNA pseudouridine2605 synthase
MLHPSREVEKVYLAKVSNRLELETAKQLAQGVWLEGRKTAPAKVRILKVDTFSTSVLVAIHEGRNRQVRRMFEAVGHQVVLLRRVQFGPLKLGDVGRGQWRHLTPEEVRLLKGL